MSVRAKCHNYSGCLVAYRGDEIDLAPGAPLVCPECGKPVTQVKGGGSMLGKLIPAAVGLALLLGVIVVALSLMPKSTPKGDAVATTESTPAAATPDPDPSRASSSPVVKAGPSTGRASAEPPQAITAPAKIDLDVSKAENRKVKEEVLTRIDVMPNVSQANKDKLYNSVERARSMGKILTIPFASGKISLSPADTQALKAALDQPEVAKLREDPTAVFVVLGYADPKGDEKKNIDISQRRADGVLGAMRDQVGVVNVMHAVAMGGSTLLDSENLEKNRIVELWAVLP